MVRRALALGLPLLTFLPTPSVAQTPREIMARAVERYEERMEGIDSYTVTQTVMDTESTIRFTRQESDGRVMFVPDLGDAAPTGPEGMDPPAGDAAGAGTYDTNYFMRDEFVERMRLEGKETVDGHETYVLVVDDFDGLDMGAFAGGATDFQPSLLKMYMDTEEYIARRLDMAGTSAMSGEPSEMSTSVLLKDYREVDGMLHPFRVEISTEGVGAAMGAAVAQDMTPEQRAELERSLAQMEKEIENLPESQRAMVRRMMEGQLEGGMAQMMDEAMSDMVVETVRLVVNDDPSGSV